MIHPAITFAPLKKFSKLGIHHCFTPRFPEAKAEFYDKKKTLSKLKPYILQTLKKPAFHKKKIIYAEQIHYNNVAKVNFKSLQQKEKQTITIDKVDALITNDSNFVLGICVADCCAVYIIDPKKRAIALAHSGKKGTELNITTQCIHKLIQSYDSTITDLHIHLSPCIHPPCYAYDIPSHIINECIKNGIPQNQITQSKQCTACHPSRFYSYNKEKGKTGRHLAFLSIDQKSN